MDHVLKTYEDGSEITIKGAFAMLALCTAAAVVGVGVVEVKNRIVDRRIERKYNPKFRKNK
jgi:hypothetical protein